MIPGLVEVRFSDLVHHSPVDVGDAVNIILLGSTVADKYYYMFQPESA